MSLSLAEPLLTLFAIMAIGWWLGQQPLRGISLGSGGVLFVALVFGHFGLKVPKEIMDLGLMFFVYAVGLQAGPRFFRTFRRQGFQFVIIALATVLTGAITTVIVARVMNLPVDLATGLFTGALTNTPALAAATDVLDRVAPGQSANIAAGYGIAYPYSMLGVVLLVQVLPRLLHRNIRHEEEQWRHDQQRDLPGLAARKFVLTNSNCFGKTVSELSQGQLLQTNISRIRRGDSVFPATADMPLQEADIVMVVGPEDELAKMRLLLGEETNARMDANTNIASVDMEVTEGPVIGKTLAEARVRERYGVVITRLRRDGLEVAPTGSATLEVGDSIRVVGEREAVDAFVLLVHGSGQKADETNMVPFLFGLMIGILAGSISLHLGHGLDLKLGTAGGVFVVSLIVGHVGHIGRVRLYVPAAANNLIREIGLTLFLAGAGTNAGGRIVPIIQERGWSLLLAGAIITTASVIIGLVVTLWLYRMNTLTAMGALCAAMTNPPGLAAANSHTSTGVPTLAYASAYPVALISKIILAQVLVAVLRLF